MLRKKFLCPGQGPKEKFLSPKGGLGEKFLCSLGSYKEKFQNLFILMWRLPPYMIFMVDIFGQGKKVMSQYHHRKINTTATPYRKDKPCLGAHFTSFHTDVHRENQICFSHPCRDLENCSNEVPNWDHR